MNDSAVSLVLRAGSDALRLPGSIGSQAATVAHGRFLPAVALAVLVECTTPAIDECLDDGLFCDGSELLDNELGCISTGSPCGEGQSCNEERNSCEPCVTQADCGEVDSCSLSWCFNGECHRVERDCGEDARCVPESNRCERLDGTDPRLTQCIDLPPECTEVDIGEYADFEAALETWAEFPSCDESTGGWLVGGQCEEDVGFVFVSDGLHERVHFFGADTGRFLGQRILSDAVDMQCVGLTYWPIWVECTGPIVTEVECGSLLRVGDLIELPAFVDWRDIGLW